MALVMLINKHCHGQFMANPSCCLVSGPESKDAGGWIWPLAYVIITQKYFLVAKRMNKCSLANE